MEGFIANLYELFGFANQGNFSNDMYNYGYYQPIFLIMVISMIIINVIYYYVVNHPRCNRSWHWLLFNIGTCIFNFILSWVISSDKINTFYAQQGMNSPYDWTSYFMLSSIASLWAFIFFFVFSFIIKWWSRNCKHSPFL